jgi:molybdate transport system substrate-binding protein
MHGARTSLLTSRARRIASHALALATVLPVAYAHAEELLVWSAGAAQAPMSELVRSYQSTSSNTIKMEYAPVGVLMGRLADGGKPDVLVLSQDVSAEVERSQWCVPGSIKPIGSVGVGVAVKEGAPMPDISTPDALRTTLLNAKSITYINPAKGTSGKHFAAVLQQLGIAEQVKAKTTLGEAGFVVEPVAHGDIEIGIQQITEILPVKGAVLVGPLPAALQKTTTYTISLGANARDTAAAKEFMHYILRDSSASVFKTKGFSVP